MTDLFADESPILPAAPTMSPRPMLRFTQQAAAAILALDLRDPPNGIGAQAALVVVAQHVQLLDATLQASVLDTLLALSKNAIEGVAGAGWGENRAAWLGTTDTAMLTAAIDGLIESRQNAAALVKPTPANTAMVQTGGQDAAASPQATAPAAEAKTTGGTSPAPAAKPETNGAPPASAPARPAV
jgi:hypothetical protein